jgi:hypothetical protein
MPIIDTRLNVKLNIFEEKIMGLIYGGIHEKIALKSKDLFGLTGMIETGTFLGETALWASNKFERVATIELNPEYYKVAERALDGTHNVLMISGDSREWLAPICRGRNNKPTLFWLDAHFYNGVDDLDPKGCPILDEIKIVNENFFGKHVIMVDDYTMLNRWFESENIISLLRDIQGHDREVRIIDDIYFATTKIPEDFETWAK